MKKFAFTALLVIAAMFFSGCEYFDNTPGSFRINFTWPADGKPDFSAKDYYAWVILEEWPDGDMEKAVLLMQTSATPFDKKGKVSIDLSDVKYGENKVIKVEIRGSSKATDRVLYFGRSELFNFSSKDRDKEVKVALQTTATPGTGDDANRFHLQIVQNGNVVNKINDTEVTVRINVIQGNRIIIANSLSILEKYISDKKSVAEGFADKTVSELKVFEGNYYDLEKWELNFGLEIAEDAGGERIVYGKLLNDDGYMSETVQVSVLVDKTLPGVINPAVTPNPAKLGDLVTAVFSFTEPLDLEKLDLDWDGLAFAESESVTENVFSYTFEVTDETEERTFSLKGRAYDEIGNGPVHFNIGELKVDRTLPTISDETVSVTNDKQAVKSGDEVTVTFKVSEELEKAPEVTIDGKKFERVGDSKEPYTYKYSVTDADIEGLKTVLVSLSDLARNQNVVEMAQTVKFDLRPPEVINPTVTPAGEPGNAGLSTKIEIRFNISEPVEELKFLVNGSESELFAETVNGLTYSYTRTVENNESASQYVFAVSAVDFAGNALEPFTLGTVAIDVQMPAAVSQTLSKTNVKLLEVFTLDLEFSEELKGVTVLVGSKDISTGCAKSATDNKKYTCTHTANADSDEGDGVKQFSVQMTDMSGNSSTVQLKKTGGSPLTIEYDVTPPAVVNPVIAPSKANSDSTIDVRFSFTEDVENVVINWDGLVFTRDNDENDRKLFIYKHKVMPADEEKSYTIKILEAFDIAGNPISSEIKIGTVEIDNTPPEIFNSVIKVSGDDSRTFVRENEVIEISFEVKEEISDHAVRIGLKKLSVCTNEDITDGKRYTCTYSTPSSVDGEGTKDVTVEVKDLAGNGTSYAVGQLNYDMSDPQLSSAIVIPERVNSSHGEVKVQFSFSEDVQIEVDEVYIIPENFGPALPLNCNTGSDYGKQFECRSFFLPEDERVENYDVSVKLRDRAGNEVPEIFIGKIEIDREKPYLSAQNVNPSAVKENELFTISFTVNEALVSKPVVKVGDKQLSESSCSGALNVVCEHNANKDGDETDGVKSITVNLRDPAGNTSIVTLSQTVTYDATRPELLNPVIIPEGTANRYNSTVQVRFSFSEKINYPDSFSFTVLSAKGGTVPVFTCTPANANHQSFTCETVFDPADETDDTLTFKVNAADLAGNTLNSGGTPVEVGVLKIDRLDPGVTFNSVSPLKVLKADSSISVVITVDEELAVPPVINIGNDLSLSSPSTSSGLEYTYIFDDLTFLSDGEKNVSVFMTDLAGNMKTEQYPQKMDVDRSSPWIIAKTVAPSIANLNTEKVTAGFTFSEKIEGFIKDHVTVVPAGILIDYTCANSSGDEQNYSCEFIMSTAGTYEGTLNFFVSGTDKSGNPMDVNPSAIGTLTVDRNAPELTFDSITPLLVNNSVTSVTVQFTVDKVPDGNPVLRIGSEKTLLSPSEVTNGGKTFEYIFGDLSGISDGNKNIHVELKDDAGNNVAASSTEQILFDRLAPTVVSKNISPAVVNKDTNQIVISFAFSEKMTALTNGNVTVSPAGLPAHNCTTADNQSYSCTIDVSTITKDEDGTYTYSVSGSDQYGNPMASSVVLGTVKIDREDLVITFGSSSPSVVISSTTSVDIVFSLSETPLENPVVKLAGLKTKSAPSNVTGLQYTYTFNELSGITDGEKTVTVQAKDVSGNSVSEDFTGPLFDRTAPTVVSKSIAPAIVNKDTGQIMISFTFSEKMTALTNGNVTVSPSGLPAHNCTSLDQQSYTCTIDVSTITKDEDGIYTYSVSGSDQYGNPMSTSVLGAVTVDRKDAIVVFNSVEPLVINKATSLFTVVFTVDELLSKNPVVILGNEISKDSPSSVSGLQYTYTFNNLAMLSDGAKILKVNATDSKGNTLETEYGTPVNVDRTPPTVLSSNVAPAFVNKTTNTLSISFSYSEPMMAFDPGNIATNPDMMLGTPTCVPFDGSNQTITCTINTSELSDIHDGSYTFTVTGTDIFGNPMTVPVMVGGTTVDRTDPDATLDVLVPEILTSVNNSLMVRFLVTETLAEDPVVKLGSEKTLYAASGVVDKLYTYIFPNLTGVTDGQKTLNVLLKDVAGNIFVKDLTGPLFDRTAPSVVSSSVAPAVINKDTLQLKINFTFNEEMTPIVKSDVTVSRTGLPDHSCTSGDDKSYECTVDVSGIDFTADGTYEFSVRAKDKYGNLMPAPVVLGSTVVDRQAPVITLNSFTPSPVNSSTSDVTVVFTVSEILDSDPVVKLGTTKVKTVHSNVSGLQYTYIFNDLSGITDGEKTINITVKDTSLNPTSTDFTGPLFDRTAPEIIAGYIYPATVNSSNDSFSIYISFNEEVLALTGTDILTDPAWMLPVPSCFNEGDQTFRCTYNITGLDVDGAYYFYVSAHDIALNSIDPDPTYVIKLGIDRTLPTATIAPVIIYDQGAGVKAGNIARAGDVVFVTVTLSEKLSETPKVRLGTELMQLQGASCVQGACNFARVIQPSEGDGLKNITVEMEDLDGNRKGDVFPDMVIIDVTPPQMHSNFVTPEYAKDNQIIEARFSFSEPVKVSSLQTTYAAAFTKDAVQSTDQLFVYTANSSSFASGSAINFEVKVTDPAGNPLNSGNWLSVGTTNIDKVLPSFTTNTCVVTVSSGYTNPAGFKAVKAGQTVTANCNITVNETIKGNPVLKVGGYAATRQGSCPGGYNNCYVYTVAGTEGDGIKTITSEVEDLAGNFSVGDTGQKVVFDFTPPRLIYELVTRTPSFAPARDSGAKTLLLCHRDPVNNEPVNVEVIVYADEEVDSTVTISNFSYFSSPSVNGNEVTLTGTMTGTETAGTYNNIKVNWQDKLGNAGSETLSWALIIDKTLPTSNSINIDNLIFVRKPWGTHDTSGLPRLSLKTEDGKTAVNGSDIVKVAVYNYAGSLIGMADVDGANKVYIPEISSGDMEKIFVNPIKKSGLKMSSNLLVKKVEWHATLSGKVKGSDFENPVQYMNTSAFANSVKQTQTLINEPDDMSGKLSAIDNSALYTRPSLTWRQLMGSTHLSPSFRYHKMVYDSFRKTFMVFGSVNISGPYEMWEYNPYNNVWKVVTSASHLEPVYVDLNGMVYDNLRNKVIIFDGRDGVLWEFDSFTSRWSSKYPFDGIKPPSRDDSMIAFYPKTGEIFIHGGLDANYSGDPIYISDTWKWDPVEEKWNEINVSGYEGPELGHAAMVYDNISGNIILQGGCIFSMGIDRFSATWSFDPETERWTQLTTTGAVGARCDHQAVYDDLNDRVLVFGGDNGTTYSNDIWGFNSVTNAWTSVNSGTALLTPVGRKHYSIAIDNSEKSLMVFGGFNDSDDPLYDTWSYKTGLNTWNEKTPYSPAVLAEIVYDHEYKRFLAVTTSSVYSLDGDTDTWRWVTNRSFNHFRYAAAWDKVNKRLVVYNVTSGGVKTLNYWTPSSKFSGVWTSAAPTVSPLATNDFTMTSCGSYVYIFGGASGITKRNQICSLGSNTWSCYSPSGSLPPARDKHSMVCADEASYGTVMVSGGSSSTGLALDDIWLFNYGEWYRNINLPNARHSHAVSYNSNGDYLILFGGEDNNGTKLGDIYMITLYSMDDGDVEEINTYVGGTVKPFARSESKISFDPLRSEHILYSGSQNETWKLSHGLNETPGHLITVPFSAAVPLNKMPEVKITDLNMDIYAGASSVINGAFVKLWKNGKWHTASGNTSASWPPSKIEVSLTENDNIEDFMTGQTNDIHIAVTAKEGKSLTTGDSHSTSLDYAEVKVSYEYNHVPGFDPDNYFVINTLSSWDNARATCLSNGMEMLSIESEEERLFISTLPGFSASNYYWLGVTDKAVAGEWRWASGEHIADKAGATRIEKPDKYNYWNSTSPTAGQCGYFRSSVSSGRWYSYDCLSELYFRIICKKPEHGMIVSLDKNTWVNARAACQSYGGDLAQFKSGIKYGKVWNILWRNADFWFGYRAYTTNNEWRWLDGTVGYVGRGNVTPLGLSHTFNNWMVNQPSSSTTGQYGSIAGNAYSFYTDFKWNDASSAQLYYYICDL